MPECEAGGARFERVFSRASSVPVRAPRFDLRVDGQGATLRLARPLNTSYGRVESCSLDLGRLPAPVDLRLGALGFRGRRRRLRRVRLWLRGDALEGWAAQRGVELHVDRARGEVAHLTLVDEQGALGFELRAWGVAGDLQLGVDALRTRSAAEDPRARLDRAALRLGLTDHRLERPLFWLLAQAFSEVGQRAPEVAELPVARLQLGDGGFWICAGEEPGELPEEPRWAPLWPGASQPSTEQGWPETLRLEQAFQAALARADAQAIAELVSGMLSTDPSRCLAAEAAHLGAPLCSSPVAARLLARAASLVTDDPLALARAAEVAPEAGRAATLQLLDVIEGSPCSDTLRGELLALASRRPPGSSELSDPALDAALERALELAPHSPDVRMRLGEAHLSRGEAAHALDHFRRAGRGFSAAGRPSASAQASLAVARALDSLGRGGAAERSLVDARAETGEAPVVLCALARRWAEAGLLADAHRAYAALLRQPSGRPGLEHALEQASRFALDQRNVAAATPLVARLVQERPGDEAYLALRDELRSLEAGVSHVNGPWDPDDQGRA